jgi:hypothetical protein
MQRKKPLKRGAPPRRSTKPIARGKPPKARKDDPTKRRFAKLRDPEYCAWIRTLRCTIDCGCTNHCDCWGRIEGAHVKARSVGGVDRGNLVPLCTRHHREQHTLGMQSFQDLYRLHLTSWALRLDAQYVAAGRGSEEGASQ